MKHREDFLQRDNTILKLRRPFHILHAVRGAPATGVVRGAAARATRRGGKPRRLTPSGAALGGDARGVPALMAGGSLVLLLTLNEFGIVLFTGAKGVITLPVLIYTRGIVTFDLPGAAVIATVQIAPSLVLYSVYRLIFARLMTGRGKGEADVVVEPAK